MAIYDMFLHFAAFYLQYMWKVDTGNPNYSLSGIPTYHNLNR